MSLFGKKKTGLLQQPPATGRRRPAPGEQSANRPQAFSYYAQRSPVQSNTGRSLPDDAQEVDRQTVGPVAVRNRPILVGVGLLVVVAGVYLSALDGRPKIVTRTSGGNAYFLQETQVYQEAAAKSLASSIANKSKLTADTAKVSADLMQDYPEVQKAQVALPLIGRQPVVYVEPYRPAFILTTVSSAAYLLDENGRALVSTSQITDPGELAVPTVQDKSGVTVTLGSRALPSDTVRFIEETAALLLAAKVQYSSIVLPQTANELHVYISGTPYYVKYNLQGEARLQTGTFLAAQARLKRDKATPAEYIDVRVPDRAYYR